MLGGGKDGKSQGVLGNPEGLGVPGDRRVEHVPVVAERVPGANPGRKGRL